MSSGHLSGFVWTITPIFMDMSQIHFTQLFSLMSACAIWRFHSGRSKVKVRLAQQPSSLLYLIVNLRSKYVTLLYLHYSVVCYCFQFNVVLVLSFTKREQTSFTMQFWSVPKAIPCLTLYHTIPTFNDPSKEPFWKHCEKRRKCW